jgi:hypothetical protein
VNFTNNLKKWNPNNLMAISSQRGKADVLMRKNPMAVGKLNSPPFQKEG